MNLSKEAIRAIMPGVSLSNLDKFYSYLVEYMAVYGIVTPLRISAFLATLGVESGSFRYVEELASGAAYEGRKDLGNVYQGDGKRYKGRGLIQITGRYNYTQMSDMLGIDFINNPQLLQEPQYAVQSACAWWYKNGLNEIADTGDIVKVTKKVNGGTNGLTSRTTIFNKALSVFGLV